MLIGFIAVLWNGLTTGQFEDSNGALRSQKLSNTMGRNNGNRRSTKKSAKKPAKPIQSEDHSNTPSTSSNPQSANKKSSEVSVVKFLKPDGGKMMVTEQENVMFTPKTFLDADISDLTKVLRISTALELDAENRRNSGKTVAKATRPQTETEFSKIFRGLVREAQLQMNKSDNYVKVKEMKAYLAIMNAFRNSYWPKMTLEVFDEKMCRDSLWDESLYQYIGVSTEERRKFLEIRKHLFHLEGEEVSLKNPSIYQIVTKLVSFILCRGGLVYTKDLFEYYTSVIFNSIRDPNHSDSSAFLAFLSQHPFLFAVIPNKKCVAARRNLPKFDYSKFFKLNFPLTDIYETGYIRFPFYRKSFGFMRPPAFPRTRLEAGERSRRNSAKQRKEKKEKELEKEETLKCNCSPDCYHCLLESELPESTSSSDLKLFSEASELLSDKELRKEMDMYLKPIVSEEATCDGSCGAEGSEVGAEESGDMENELPIEENNPTANDNLPTEVEEIEHLMNSLTEEVSNLMTNPDS
uniref:DUF4806 domain-containing protein n=1 Tax=Caenorhabditis tropicalis TaxID=1561998 RepID=A0A1I7T1H0_9PELO